VVAIERGEELFVEFDHNLEIHPGDTVYLCGSEHAVAKYFADFPEARGPSASAIR
jgi:K+/H+ antiporter YhaU regulatory subunit KhtT